MQAACMTGFVHLLHFLFASALHSSLGKHQPRCRLWLFGSAQAVMRLQLRLSMSLHLISGKTLDCSRVAEHARHACIQSGAIRAAACPSRSKGGCCKVQSCQGIQDYEPITTTAACGCSLLYQLTMSVATVPGTVCVCVCAPPPSFPASMQQLPWPCPLLVG